ncbi:MAG: hypothetical protein KC543_11410 [Myxococcales bacterium]|nr:hypothetical protein [Myxococcales bacterium]
MIEHARTLGLVGMGGGLLVQWLASWAGGEATTAGVVLGLVAATLLICGCGLYAKAKGYPAWFGIAGLLSAGAVAVALLVPDRTAFARPARMQPPPDGA